MQLAFYGWNKKQMGLLFYLTNIFQNDLNKENMRLFDYMKK